VYLGFDNQVHTVAPGRKFYSDMSLWDTHRSLNPMLVLLAPDVAADITESLVTMANQGGALPRWPMANGYTECMISSHGIQVLADTALKGITNWNVSGGLYHAVNMLTNPDLPHGLGRSLGDFLTMGFVASETDSKCACLTLSYAFDCNAGSTLAALVGDTNAYNVLHKLAHNYVNTWSVGDQFMCPRSAKGLFDCPPGTTDVFDDHYVEGDEWQWRWFVPHDPEGLGTFCNTSGAIPGAHMNAVGSLSLSVAAGLFCAAGDFPQQVPGSEEQLSSESVLLGRQRARHSRTVAVHRG
jgi:putative alpha-1,2-mannosidase